ncbi:uncharacterized protein LOC106090305 [Stomoxys calcitrans]|uniref:MADF domain-containing protein n=1 Tax=Stomoxys calcitrans TaxID=35570 RepID=A0A1I8Q1Y2_STOCA|nr:uncharacterized protein LOC106090305 [Stomoxys calcitrans]
MPENMECIVLDDDNAGSVESIDVESDPLATNNGTGEKKGTRNFEKRLIRQVRQHRILYDNRHKSFSNIDKKEIVWQEIGKTLKSDVETCKSTWIDLRYKYQCFVRRLRKYYISKTKKKSSRPSMNLESELVFLFRFMDIRKSCSIPYDIIEPESDVMEIASEAVDPPDLPATQPISVDDDLILVEQPVELIVIDEDDDAKHADNVFKVTKEMRVLVAQIKKYPELYDSSRTDFADYSRKSYVWNSIAISIGDKATKLMKCWILMTTRFEWEISRNNQNSDVAKYQTELQKELEFFEPYILANPNTVYKNSFYLKKSWCEPIDYFKEIYNLIVRMKKLPDVVFVTDSLLTNSEKTKQFFSLWADISKMKGNAAGECETTWLIMRSFYWELMNMRKQNYQLTDKWYFETIITELYELAKQSPAAKQVGKQTTEVQNGNTATKSKFQYLNKTNTNVGNTNGNGTASAKAMSTNVPTTQQSVPGPLPKITSAISLAPQVLAPLGGSGSLQIRPIGGMNSNLVISPPKPASVLNQSLITPTAQATSTSTTTTIQLPYALPHQTQLSAVSKPSNAKANCTGSSVQTNVKSAVNATAGISNNQSKITIGKAPAAPKVDLSPMVCINTAIKSTTIGSMNSAALLTSSSSESKKPSSKTDATQIASSTITSSGQPVPPAVSSLPKISGAMSLLNPNEILIELIASQSGNHLVVHGPPLSEKYHLSMDTVAKFIREAMAIPLLHNKRHNQPNLINSYWEHISTKFKLPPHICRACWNFLVENFNHFPQIAPLKELMKPFSTSLKVWTVSYNLFNVFDKNAESSGWLNFMPRLPEVVECIGSYPVLYRDVAINAKDTPATSEMEALCVWRTISLRFPKINDISTIWTAFKNVFCQYMSDIEFGIDNKWHINWWRVLAKMKFLVETRYSTNEPYYYIVSNKMMEEIDRCATIEMNNRYGTNDSSKKDQKPCTSKSYLANIQVNATPKQNVEMVTLLMAVEKYPHIYEKGDCMQKLEAWKNVSRELNMDVSDCLLEFRRACRKYCAFKRQDSLSRCHLNQKYYKRFENILRNVKTVNRRRLNIKTPFELNHGSVDDEKPANSSTEFVFPERFISDINMSNCDSDLAVKNWVYALGNLPAQSEVLQSKLKVILRKHLPPNKSKAK